MVVEMAAEAGGDRGAIVDVDDGREISYRELAARVRHRAAWLSEETASAGAKHVAFLGLSGARFVEHLLAAAWAGLPFVPLNYRARPAELAALLEPFSPLLLVHGPEYVEKAAACAGPHDTAVVVDGITPGAAPGPYPADGELVAVVLHTSGTTSAPKAVLLRHRHLCSYIFGTVDFAAAGVHETALVTTPPYHIAGIMGVLTPLYAGRRMAFLPQFDPRRWLEVASACDVTHAFVVPTMLARIVDVLAAEPELQPRSLRHLAYGGGPIHLSLVERALDLFPAVDFVNAYGLTETSSTVALLGPEDHRTARASDDPRVRARLSSVGRPLPGVEIRIVDDQGAGLPQGEAGTIAIAGAQVSGQYHGRDAGQGWFVTGDLGRLDEDGYLYIGSRSDDVIIRGGENISPGEVEEVLARHPAVRAAAVVGIPDEEWGQRIVAFVETRDGARVDGEELRELTRSSLASFKVPESVVVVDELPRNDTGKVLRTRLRDVAVEHA